MASATDSSILPVRPTSSDDAGGEGKAVHISVAAALERKIVNGDYSPGQRLTEREICKQFGCTNAAAREVFHILGLSGVIHLSSRRGASVFKARFQPPQDILKTWQCLFRLLLSEVRAARPGEGTRPPRPGPVDTRYDHLVAVRGWLTDLGDIAQNQKLATMLSRIATHVFVGAPELIGKLANEAKRAEPHLPKRHRAQAISSPSPRTRRRAKV